MGRPHLRSVEGNNVSLESPIPNRSVPTPSCKECEMYDRFGVDAIALINGKCSCTDTDMLVCEPHLDYALEGRVRCQNCHEQVQITVVERFGVTL